MLSCLVRPIITTLKQLDQTDNNQTIKAEIQAIFTEHKGNYDGYRRITLALRNRGFVVSHKKVQRLMKSFLHSEV